MSEPWFPTQTQRDRYDELAAEVRSDGTCAYCGKVVLVGIGHEECGPNAPQTAEPTETGGTK